MSANEDPAVLRRRLQRELRRFRGDAKMTQAAVASAMDWSPSKVIRIETGAVAVATNDLKVLLGHYGIHDPVVVERLLKISRDSKRPSPWAEYESRGAITHESATYFGQEASAAIIRQFEPLLFPGLLQTEEYMRSVLATTRRSMEQIDDAVEARLKRQEIFDYPDDMPELFFILDESMLHRQVGSRSALIKQLAHLEELASRDRITIQVVRLGAGAYPGLLGPFTLLEFTDDDPVLYLESRFEIVTREGSEIIGEYLDSFQTMEKQTASKPQELGELIHSIVEKDLPLG
jgi:transcriptional regulator with XRE-family HTH domain